jgi:hypothetical protein
MEHLAVDEAVLNIDVALDLAGEAHVHCHFVTLQ